MLILLGHTITQLFALFFTELGQGKVKSQFCNGGFTKFLEFLKFTIEEDLSQIFYFPLCEIKNSCWEEVLKVVVMDVMVLGILSVLPNFS